ncbi:unnamed protein product [Caenorhabditis auriculariae]|uniref:Alpha/beta hydrolase fold-3 domain-containing protein n=1 Tax=Caenorhabditis auriculariae TaxID=2777116 RepID=A0A8S1H1T2_9PELO|nr:unnamed protein product [Caenorhabditis auriculariae]
MLHTGNGLQRQIKVELKLSSKTRFANCRLMYRLVVPKTMFLDVYSVNSSVFDYDFVSPDIFNNEALAINSKPHTVFFYELSFPMNLRYPPLSANGEYQTTLKAPEVGLDCAGFADSKTRGCDKLQFSKDPRLTPISSKWLMCKTSSIENTFTLRTGEINHFFFVLGVSFVLIPLSNGDARKEGAKRHLGDGVRAPNLVHSPQFPPARMVVFPSSLLLIFSYSSPSYLFSFQTTLSPYFPVNFFKMTSKVTKSGLAKFLGFYFVSLVFVAVLLYRPLPDGFTRTTTDRFVMHVVEPALRATYYWPSQYLCSKASSMVWWTRIVLNNMVKLIGPIFTSDKDLIVNTTLWNGVKVRTYIPVMNVTSGRGAVLFIHGGGFALGNIDMYDSLVRRMAKLNNVLYASVEYRLSPETPFPGGILDCEAALDYLVQHGQHEFRIDTSKIVVMGDSAGGNLAAVVSQRRVSSGKQPAIRAQSLIYPLLQMADMQTVSYRYFKQRLTGYALVDPTSVAYYYMFYAGINMDEKDYLVPHVLTNGHVADKHKSTVNKAMSHAAHIENAHNYNNYSIPAVLKESPSEEAKRLMEPFIVNPDFSPLMRENLSDLPPTFVLTCEFDVLRDEGIMYAKRLEEAGVPTLHRHYINGFHAMLNFHNELEEATLSLLDIVRWTANYVN